MGTVLDGKGNLRLYHVQAVGADHTVEAEVARGTLAAIVRIGEPEHRQDGVRLVAHGELGTVGKDKVHTEAAVRAVDGLAVIGQTCIDEHLFRFGEEQLIGDVPIAFGHDVHNFAIGYNDIFKPFTGFHLGKFPEGPYRGRYKDLVLLQFV
ncbi:hypothetical protein I215_06597 [Galbibacter marinus]|uniref:Uncharacterized protein n=1 Tax=Galbibacter marinus TaxID=555500 RepID=K2Q431_9FLAO|nr:hypothetical protein I215_06597 [Galbibacter marinus]